MIERPPLYTSDSVDFTLSPKQFVSWWQYLLFSKENDAAVIDLDSPELDAMAKNMQEQIKGGENIGKKKGK